MTALTIRHSERGIKAIEYGVVGDVLFWCIKVCVGDTIFTDDVLSAWVKIFSRMLRTIVPIAVQFERRGMHQSKQGRTLYEVSSVKELPSTTMTSAGNRNHNDTATTTK